jgi:hypothetical protein
MTIEEAEHYLQDNKFVRMNMSALQSPEAKYEPSIRAIVERDASYEYILNLRERDLTVDGRAKYAHQLAQYREQLATLRADMQITPCEPFIGAKIWLRELAKLETIVAFGRKTYWQYENYGRFVFESGLCERQQTELAPATRKRRAKGKLVKRND